MTTPESSVSPNRPRASQPDPLTLDEILRVSLRHKKMIGWVVLGFLALGLVYAFFAPPTYEARVGVKVPDSSQSAMGMLRVLAPTGTKSGDPLETFLGMAESDNVAYRVMNGLNLMSRPEYKDLSPQEIVLKLGKAVQVLDQKKSNLFDIQVRSHDSRLAADMANAWAEGFIQLNLDLSHQGASSRRKFLEEQTLRLEKKARSRIDELVYGQLMENLQAARLDENTDDTGIYIIDRAVAPEKPVKPKKSLALVLALILGLGLGIQAAFLLERTRDRIESEAQLKRVSQMPNYAIIPNFRGDYPAGMSPPDIKERFSPKALINNPVFLHSRYRESLKMFRTNLTLAQAGKAPRVIAVLSSNPEEGKTLVNANLAIAMAETGAKTLLIDADLRKSSLLKTFGLVPESAAGISLVLAGQGDWKKMIRPSEIKNLDLLPNTVTPPNPAELLGSPAMGELIAEFKKSYDLIVFDAAPVLPVTDSVVLSTFLDAVVLLARWNSTRVPELERSLDLLKSVKAPLLGTILNNVDLQEGLYGFGGYGYGKYVYGTNDPSAKVKK